MKKFAFIKSLSALAIWLMISSGAVADTYHVVVGSFEESAAALRFAKAVEAVFDEVSVTYDGDLKMHYVSALTTDRYDVAASYRDHVRTEKGFVNAWVYADFNQDKAADGDSVRNPIALELFTGGTVLLSSTDNSHIAIASTSAGRRKKISESQILFTFVARTINGILIPGSVTVMDNDGNSLTVIRTGDVVNIAGQYENRRLRFVFRSEGYSPVARVIDLAQLGRVPGINLNEENTWEVQVAATKLHPGKIHLSYNDLFYKDASVLNPDRKELLDELVSVLKLHDDLGIAINTHCQAGEKRSMVLSRSANFFDISQGVEKSGSDKQLTKSRAEVLVAYLVSQGVEPKRISALGWGSLDPLVREGNAAVNDRVDVVLDRI